MGFLDSSGLAYYHQKATERNDGEYLKLTLTESISNVDLDDYKTEGNFRVSGSTNAATITHSPSSTEGYKLVVMCLRISGDIMQIAFGNIWVRYRVFQNTSQTWTSWRKFIDNENIGDYALPISGGTLTGEITRNGKFVCNSEVDSYISLYGGSGSSGANLILRGSYYHQTTGDSLDGSFVLGASNDAYFKYLIGKPDGTLTWGGTAISLNGHTHSYLPLSGGTVTGSVTQTMGDPSVRSAYIVKYSDITDNTSPSANKAGYGLLFADKNDVVTGGVYKNYQSNGWTSTRLADNKNSDLAAVQVEHGSSNARIFRPTSDNNMSLGTSSYRWSQLYAGTTTIATSDERLKDNISAVPDSVLDAWGEVNWCQYQFKESIAEKGENARYHIGAIAQRIKQVFESHNIDPFKYGLLCYDEWEAEEEERDADGNVIVEARPEGNRYSLRYEEVLCMEAAYQRRRADRLESRIEAIERAINDGNNCHTRN